MAVRRFFFNYTEVGVINTNCFSVSNISTFSLLYLNDYDWTGYDILKNKCCKIFFFFFFKPTLPALQNIV